MERQIFKIARAIVTLCLWFGLTLPVSAQMPNTKFRVYNREVTIDNDSKVVRLNAVDSVGIAWLINEEFTFGEIEFDVKGVDLYQGSFLGMAFHGTDNRTYEAIYFRPFNFRTSDSLRKSHAVQYLSNPEYYWPLLRERYPGRYEKGMPSGIDPNGWFHVKLVVSAKSIGVYVNRDKLPVLRIKPLNQRMGKMIGYWVGSGSGGEWKNFHMKKWK